MKQNIFVFLVILSSIVYGQKLQYSIFDGGKISSTRKIILLNEGWNYIKDESTEKVRVPFWLEDEKVTLTRSFPLVVDSGIHVYLLHFEGIKGLLEVYFNDERIPFDPAEIEQFVFRIPTLIVRENSNNSIKIILSKRSLIKEQNTLISKLELPERKAGIYKDIYFEILSHTAITNVSLYPTLNPNLNEGLIKLKLEIALPENYKRNTEKNYQLKVLVKDKNSQTVVSEQTFDVFLSSSLNQFANSLTIKNPGLWDLNNPFIYEVQLQLLENNQIIDESFSNVSFRRLEISGSKFLLNNNPIILRGITYFESNGKKNSFFTLEDYSKDIELVKELNANAIYLKNSLPSEELLNLCEENGILVFVDLDSKIYPEDYSPRLSKEFDLKLNYLLNKYSNFGCLAGINIGILKNKSLNKLQKSLVNKLKDQNQNILIFAETDGLNLVENFELDFIAVNLLHQPIKSIQDFISKIDKEKFTFSYLVGYQHDNDANDGYSNPHSTQAQAKYLSDILKNLIEREVSVFVHTLADYRLSYHSILSGTIDNTLCKYGLVNEYRDRRKLSFNTVRSYYTNSKLPLIMQGSFEDKANIIFVITGLLFLAISIIIINSTHRLKESVPRSILKTYNFFSDIRDGWFISSFHSVLLAIVIALALALNYSTILHYWRSSIEFEKFIALLNSNLIFEFFSYISWRPISSILYLFIINLVVVVILTSFIKLTNYLVRNKVFINQIFLLTVWSAIPFLILIPVGMVSYKVFTMEKFQELIYLIVLVFHIWVITRLLKGISIVFDVSKSKVYLFAIFFILISIAGYVLYLQFYFSSINYLMYLFG